MFTFVISGIGDVLARGDRIKLRLYGVDAVFCFTEDRATERHDNDCAEDGILVRWHTV